MTRRPHWLSLASLGATGVLVASMSRCGARGPAPAATPYPDPAEQPPAPTADIAEYPNYGGERRLRGEHLQRPAVQRQPQEDLRARRPDGGVRVLRPERGVPVAGGLRVAGHRRRPVPDRSRADGTYHQPNPNGTGPTRSAAGTSATGIKLTANDAYWGSRGADAEPRVPVERPGAASVSSCSSGGRRHRQPGQGRPPAIEGDSNFKVNRAKAPTRCTWG